jgi:hypothetical protein
MLLRASEILKQVPVLQETSPNRKRKHHFVEVFLTDFSSILATASIGAIHVLGRLQLPSCSNVVYPLIASLPLISRASPARIHFL